MALAKVIVVLDKDVNVRDPKEAWWVALNHIDPERDVRFTMGPIDVLDHSSRGFTYGSKMGDRKSTRLNSSHSQISYAVFCLKKKKKKKTLSTAITVRLRDRRMPDITRLQ